MRVVVQRVERADVKYGGEEIARIGGGLVLYVGITRGEADGAGSWLVGELQSLLAPDDAILCLSQFTLFASFKGCKPSFHRAEAPAVAEPYFSRVFEELSTAFPGRVKRGLFGRVLQVGLSGAGMDTLLLER